MDMSQSSVIFIGIKGTVLALDRATGQEVWRSKLKSADFTNVVLQDGSLYAATEGELFCLDPATGQVRWHNQLKGLGLGLITIGASGGQQIPAMWEKKRQDAAAAAAATTAAT